MTVRLAGPDDAAALVVLRAAMFEAMGRGAADDGWRPLAEEWFARELAPGGDAIAAVADVPGEGPVASALAVLVPKAPGPGDPSARSAHVSQVSTLPAHRRRGHAAACLALLLRHLDAAGIGRADLHATPQGDALYRAAGFVPAPYPALRRRTPIP